MSVDTSGTQKLDRLAFVQKKYEVIYGAIEQYVKAELAVPREDAISQYYQLNYFVYALWGLISRYPISRLNEMDIMAEVTAFRGNGM